MNDFINRYSDEEFDSIYLAKGKLPSDYAEILFNPKIGESFGPYKDINSFKISKLVDKKRNSSIRASHILILITSQIKSLQMLIELRTMPKDFK